MTTNTPNNSFWIDSSAGAPRATVFNGVKAQAAIIGETLTFTPQPTTTGTFAGTVVTAPPGSTAAFSGSTLAPDLPGRYRLTVANGNNPPVQFDVVAFPAAALTFSQIAQKNYNALQNPSVSYVAEARPDSSKRFALRNIAQGAYGNFSDATFAALSSSQPIPVGIDPSKFPS